MVAARKAKPSDLEWCHESLKWKCARCGWHTALKQWHNCPIAGNFQTLHRLALVEERELERADQRVVST